MISHGPYAQDPSSQTVLSTGNLDPVCITQELADCVALVMRDGYNSGS